MHVFDQLVHTTVRIQSFDSNGQASSGTGFVFNFCETDGKHVPALVTNKHVIDGAAAGLLTFQTADGQGNPAFGKRVDVPISQFEDGWIKHPDNNVDLAVFPLAGIYASLRSQGTEVFVKAVGRSLLALDEDLQQLTAVEDILMIGYPNSLWDSLNNLPIIRRGVTATPLYIDFEGRKEFMIDCACFPGSSGSPIFLYSGGSYAQKTGGYTLGGRLKFVGILWGGPQYTSQGQIVAVPIPTSTQPISLSRIPMNLGYCVKAEQLLVFEDHFQKLVSVQAAALAQAATSGDQQS